MLSEPMIRALRDWKAREFDDRQKRALWRYGRALAIERQVSGVFGASEVPHLATMLDAHPRTWGGIVPVGPFSDLAHAPESPRVTRWTAAVAVATLANRLGARVGKGAGVVRRV